MGYTISEYIKSTWMCVKYPFLYPRNRWTGSHYNNWKLINRSTKLAKEHLKPVTDKDGNISDTYEMRWDNRWVQFKHWFYLAINDFLGIFHFMTPYTEWDTLKVEAPGWYSRFGQEMLDEIRRELKSRGMLYKWRITQIKEKWGELTLYYSGGTDRLERIIDKYVEKSRHICIDCGKDANVITSPYGWMCPYCRDCYDEKHSGQAVVWCNDGKSEITKLN